MSYLPAPRALWTPDKLVIIALMAALAYLRREAAREAGRLFYAA